MTTGHWIVVPSAFAFGFNVNATSVILFVVLLLPPQISAFGFYPVVGAWDGQDVSGNRMAWGAFSIALTGVLAGVLGTFSGSVYPENVGLLRSSKVGSRWTTITCGGLFTACEVWFTGPPDLGGRRTRPPTLAGMSDQTIRLDVEDRIATLTLDRPDRLNAFTVEMAREMVAAFDRIDADDDIRAVILTGAGRAFCAGADLQAGGATFDYAKRGGRERPEGSKPPRDQGGVVNLRIFQCLKPVIAAVNGHAVGVGATMILPCDVRLAAEGAKFGYVFGARGIVPDGAASWFLPKVVGVSRALEWCLTGRVFPVSEALEAGLVRRVLPVEDLLPAARELAGEMAANVGPVSSALTRQMLWRLSAEKDPMVAHQVDSEGIFETGALADATEGVTAFLEKRPAAWKLRVSRDLPPVYPWWEQLEY